MAALPKPKYRLLHRCNMGEGRRTIAVIGAGNVGATCAFALAERKLGNIVMLDIYEGFAKGKALDMSQAGQILNYDGVILSLIHI